MIVSVATYAQTQYTVVKVATVSVNSSGQWGNAPFKQLSKTFIAFLYSNYLVFDEGFDGKGDTYYKFAREIDLPDKRKWNATDRNGTACEITIKDFGSYTLIAIKYMNSNQATVYQTL